MHYPTFDELCTPDQDDLMNLSIDQYVIRVDKKEEETWIDDNCFCFNIIINDIKVSFWWTDAKYYAACLYCAVSEEAARKVYDLINDAVSSHKEK